MRAHRINGMEHKWLSKAMEAAFNVFLNHYKDEKNFKVTEAYNGEKSFKYLVEVGEDSFWVIYLLTAEERYNRRFRIMFADADISGVDTFNKIDSIINEFNTNLRTGWNVFGKDCRISALTHNNGEPMDYDEYFDYSGRTTGSTIPGENVKKESKNAKNIRRRIR